MDQIKAVKAVSYFILVPLFTYTGISGELISILTVLIFFDIVTAVIREYLAGFRITSRMFWIGVSAKLLLILVPFIVILVGKGSGIDLLALGKLTISTFIVAEGYSTIGNIIQIRKKDVTIDEQDAITGVIKGIEKTFKQVLANFMQK